MSKLGLEPARVFHYFEELSKIPHGSGNTKAISDYCKEWAIEKGYEYHQDDSNNIIIIKEASEGKENEPPIIIQGHLDMVCEKAEGVAKDMESEGLDLYVDGDFLKAKGTTLGGDDGIAVAMAMALLEDEELSHPRLEAVFTVDEEIGMLGASALDVTPLKGKTMLNIDSEEEGVFTVSCAGGVVATCAVPFGIEESADKSVYSIEVSGLTGGHSGIEIHKGRASANKVMAQILNDLSKNIQYNLVKINGGLKDNAIPVQCEAVICCYEKKDEVENIISQITAPIIEKHKDSDPGFSVKVEDRDNEIVCMSKDATARVVDVLYSLPEGVQKMSQDVDGLVQTSLNMGILVTDKYEVKLSYCVRSSVDAEKRDLLNIMRDKMENVFGKLSTMGDYPGWEYRKNSPLRDLMTDIYKEQYGKEPVIEAIHAGVECGLFAGKIPDLDCVSYGPNLSEIHTFRESMSISSVQRVYAMTRKIIETGV